MIKRTLDRVLSEDMSEIWALLDNDEKRRIIDAFTIHNFKKNQRIYAEGEEPEYLWCLLSGKVKKFKDGMAGTLGAYELASITEPMLMAVFKADLSGK